MKTRVVAFLTRSVNDEVKSELQQLKDEVSLLKDEVSLLKAELDEFRRDSLRVAEMLDLIEQRLTPPADPTMQPSKMPT